MNQANKRQPTVFIGLGGAGGKIVNRIARILRGRADWRDLERTMQFFAIDTDKADLDACVHINQGHRLVISGFDKGLWATEKLGRSGISKPNADPRVAQWVHDWYNFRSSQGVGAGQIRIESRISLYNCLETTDLISRLEKAILETIDMNNANLAHEVKRFNVFIYYTVAGGTGSGCHLMLAAFLRHLIGSFGWSANIIGVSMLSTLMLPVMRNMRQREDIMANGYAAMKEDEHLLRLKVYADQRDPTNRRDFVFHPFIASMEVTESPFDFIYVLDTNPEVYIQDFRSTVADGIYLQLFSPIFGKRNSDYDNFEKNQKRLSRGLYSTFYGSYGCSVLLLPDNNLFEYCKRRRTADLIAEQLMTRMVLALPTGEKRYEPTTEQLSRIDTAEQNRLRDKLFVEYVRDRVKDVEKAKLGDETDRTCLKKHGRALVDAGFGLFPDLDILEKNLATIADKPLDTAEKSALTKSLMPKGGLSDDVATADDATTPKTFDFRANLQPYMLGFRDCADKIGGVVLAEKTEIDRYRFAKGLMLDFWTYLDERCMADVGVKLADWRHRAYTGMSASARDNPELTVVCEELARSIKNNRRDIGALKELAGRRTAEARGRIDRAFVLEYLSQKLQPFELQRLFVITQLRLSRAYVQVVDRIFQDTKCDVDRAGALLGDIETALRSDDDLTKASRTTLLEQIRELRSKEGAVDYRDAVARWDDYIRRESERYVAFIYLKLFRDIHARLVEVLEDLATTLRLFSQQAEDAIRRIEVEAEDIRRSPGGQAVEYHNDIEALQDFTGERMWREYYGFFVRPNVNLREDELHEIIAKAFSDRTLITAQDQLDAIAKQMDEIIGRVLQPVIVGRYSEGTEERGLTLQQALVAEARLKYRQRLEDTGRLDPERAELWEKIATAAVAKPHSRSEREMLAEMTNYSENYLQSKIAVALRRSAIMANIAMQDSEVTEFSCKQAVMCYDTDLYGNGEGEGDGSRLAFPILVKKTAPEFMAEPFTGYGKMVIFYQAILGVPPFVFRNLVTGMKEAYNKRVGERDWTNPLMGRQYPLHVDRNWEPGDPGIDETMLPMSLDPEEAVRSTRTTNEGRSRFFAYWYAFFRAGHIVREEGRGFYVPAGKLGNTTDQPVMLGATAREAILAMMKSHSAHETLKAAFDSAPPLEKAELEAQRDRCRELMGGDAWGRDKPDPEIRELGDLIDEYVQFLEAEEAQAARRRQHAETYERCAGKKV